MSLRAFFILILIAALGASFFWIDNVIETFTLVSPDPKTQKLTIAAKGWDIVITLWPITLLGAIVTGTIALLMIGYTYGIVGDKDTDAKIAAIKQSTKNEIERIKSETQHKASNAQSLYNQAIQTKNNNEKQFINVKNAIEQVQREKQAALDSEAETIKKNERMYHQIERMKKKICKLESEKV